MVHNLVDVLFWVVIWNMDKIHTWISGEKPEKTATAHTPDFRDLHPTVGQSNETFSPSPNSKASDQNEESSDYNFIITPSESE
jgi:hypothetical protein